MNTNQPLQEMTDNEVLRRSRTIAYGADAQRHAIQEARRRHIFDFKQHILESPIVKSGLAGQKLKDPKSD